jgi:hypothetical protein
MFKRQIGLVVMAFLVLSPSLVHANDVDDDDYVSVGNIHIQKNQTGTSIKTPNIQIETPKTADKPILNRNNRQRNRPASIRRGQPSPQSGNIFNQRVEQRNETVTTTNNPSVFRSSTTNRSSNGSESVSQQRHSVNCSGGGSVQQSSTTTVNGRTVHSESSCP